MKTWPISVAAKEDVIHRALVQHLQVRVQPGVLWWHTPNGDIRHKGAGGRLKALGTKAGMPDLMFLCDGCLYALELKRSIGGRVSQMQTQRLSELAAAGAETCVAHGLDAALGALQRWGLIR